MILVFGGAYNGKLDFVKTKFNIDDDEIYFCNGYSIEYEKKVICGLHIFIKSCVINDMDSLEILNNNLHRLKDKIIICDEICSGIVPIEKIDRIWREQTGKSVKFLSDNSEKVYRIFFGIEEEIKNSN